MRMNIYKQEQQPCRYGDYLISVATLLRNAVKHIFCVLTPTSKSIIKRAGWLKCSVELSIVNILWCLFLATVD
jgi:hypothetical protein